MAVQADATGQLREFAWALVPAIALLVLWELGKLIARRSTSTRSGPAPDHWHGNQTAAQ